MSKEILKIEKGLTGEFNDLIQEEGKKIVFEERLKKTLRALDVLQQEKKISLETKLDELVQIVKERQRELRDSDAYAKDTAQSPATDEMSTELRDIAQKESAKVKRLLNHIDTALDYLVRRKESGYYPDKTLKDILSDLKNNLKTRETQTEFDEQKKRNGEK